MDNEIKAWIVLAIVTVVFVADDIFSFLSKGWNDALLVVIGIAFLYLLVKSAVKEALREHDRNK